ncbi:S1 domain-containing RNA-binding protein [Fructilactobacillus myrtifloralis]|uniref:S1 domain-containing RNA-binding protein n=1 Tax=Fructilactobacillus myrtifloralis TaxID=2940301 RepID=A0ABY5BMR0_9LACO|nr:S1 domain-containing RNA-binding protein [Fructilactobacillus myrtifloralis]USS84887.1 S1 domain-containing RNA-binding protein [Fructilactobacillus myrtifloralis]
MAFEVGEILTGKVSGITGFGAFVDLGNHQTGLVHISEVADGYVKDIHDQLAVGDQVQVKVTKIGSDGKIGLSIRKATAQAAQPQEQASSSHQAANPHPRAQSKHRSNPHTGARSDKFDDLLSSFLKESESRLSSIRKNTEGKRGGRGGRRS